MSLQSQKANDIIAYIKQNENCKLENYKHVVEISGKRVPCDTYMLPISLIQYNHDNGRFCWEIQEKEIKLKRKLNPLDPDDVKIIRDLLLQDEGEAEKLYEDIKRVGQLEPGAITNDGVLINGNRRMATLQKLHKDDPSGKWEKIWVFILPKGISDKDLWRIEAGLQLSEKKIAEYGPLNELLKIKEGKKAGLNEAEIAASMYGWDEEKVKEKLVKLNLIDNFLQLIGQPNNYGVINTFSMNEIFEDVQKILRVSEKKGISKKEINQRLQKTYILIRTKIPKYQVKDFDLTYNQVRTLGKVFNTTSAKQKFDESFEGVKDITKVDSEKLVTNFNEAIDILDYQKYKDKPKDLLTKALSALQNIDIKNAHFKTKEVKDKLIAVEKKVISLKKSAGIK